MADESTAAAPDFPDPHRETADKAESEWLPFAVEAPPRGSLVQGHIFALCGTLMVIAGFLGGGLAANGAAWLIIDVFRLVQLPFSSSTVALACLLAIPIGAAASVYGLSQGTRLRRKGRRLRAKDARRVIEKARGRIVLLLRSFEDEELQDSAPVNFLQQRFEEKLARVLGRIAPVITVGRPGDELGFAGAARLYVGDAIWQTAVLHLMKHSVAVTIIVGRTQGIWWEVEVALEQVQLKRLLFCFPYVTQPITNSTRIGDVIAFTRRWNLTRKLFAGMEEERNSRYQEFLTRVPADLRWRLPPKLEGSCFLHFLADGRARVLPPRMPCFLQLFNPFAGSTWNFIGPQRFRRAGSDIKRTLRPFTSKWLE